MTSSISIGSGFGACKYDHWNESYFVVISCGVSLYDVLDGSNFRVWPLKWQLKAAFSCCTVHYAVQGDSNSTLQMQFWSLIVIMKLIKQCFPVVGFVFLKKVVQALEIVGEILKK